MHKNNSFVYIKGILGKCGNLDVFMGFASADLLHSISFADVLNEDTGEGYQRPYNKAQSVDFKNYILKPCSSTIPLTFNLRKDLKDNWELSNLEDYRAILKVKREKKCLAQVDCQHRISELTNVNISLAFMTFIGLDLKQEMALFYIINSKARGLTSSLIDFHKSNLLSDIANEAPHLFIARKLNEDPNSPWFKLIKYGGKITSSPKRRTSLRMMQNAIDKLLKRVKMMNNHAINEKYNCIQSYWCAIKTVFSDEWKNHRHNLLTKGLGVYSLSLLLSDIILSEKTFTINQDKFIKVLMPLKKKINWDVKGMFANIGGHKGALMVYNELRKYLKI